MLPEFTQSTDHIPIRLHLFALPPGTGICSDDKACNHRWNATAITILQSKCRANENGTKNLHRFDRF